MQRPRTEGNRDALEVGQRLEAVRARITHAAARAGRNPKVVTLVAVSKTVDAPRIYAAYLSGQRDFGENRVEDALHKQPALPDDIIWHMIGHIQSRKARDVVGRFALVHSVDSLALAEVLQRRAEAADADVSILLEVNISGEESKYGFKPGDVASVVAAIQGLRRLQIRGLMTMAPIVDDPEQARPVFRGLRALRDELAAEFPTIDWTALSMGMTDDFEVAIEEGATIVRVGRAIFGERTMGQG